MLGENVRSKLVSDISRSRRAPGLKGLHPAIWDSELGHLPVAPTMLGSLHFSTHKGRGVFPSARRRAQRLVGSAWPNLAWDSIDV
jgi:hypothetical protein